MTQSRSLPRSLVPLETTDSLGQTIVAPTKVSKSPRVIGSNPTVKRKAEDHKKTEEASSGQASSVKRAVSVAGPFPPIIDRSSIQGRSSQVVSNTCPPKVKEVVSLLPRSSKPLVVPSLSATNGGEELPVDKKRVKVIHSNGYSLNYVPQDSIPLTEDLQHEVFHTLNKNLNQIVKEDLLTQLKPSNTGSNFIDSPEYDIEEDTDFCWFESEINSPKRLVGIDQDFRDYFPDRQSLLSVPVDELPSIPLCPDMYIFNAVSLHRPKISQKFLDLYPSEALIYSTVRSFWKPNYLGAKIKVSSFPIDKWASKLQNYPDQPLLQFLEYGWPVGYEGDKLPTLGLDNHSSSTNYGKDIQKYLDKELGLGALKGPFSVPPFEWIRTNPLMTRPKKDSQDRRVILDLSFPLGSSVNSEISKIVFEGAPYKLRLPSPLDLAEHIAKRGQGCLMFKIDLARAYRQLPSDPWDWALLGLQWNDELYFDTAIPFGVRHGLPKNHASPLSYSNTRWQFRRRSIYRRHGKRLHG